ncbi:Probable U3 small nucleolar RNA-associated protein 11 [Seminavis robusta]|uniref:U3 small nucleolar RNA-associated protein 11 n=1 Tax=Seminavis robusta TaxID=568900 RepID=A0A9N8H403_9STRA|nr:Probable U3 small nucleolar RNA-associated protein 11 [Seminavis robusta]|eukprot:Sro49_g028910.1 Probable U3 small nucleolar RNA-associated protein 11 (278) ;mRNA; r:149963-150796
MPGSSLRNAVKRITHKERSQPQARSHLGLLEKHGDYKKRAVHYHAQEDRLRNLKEKAAMRNPDEFYFGMHKAQVTDARGHQMTEETRNEKFSDTIGPEAVRVMKSQDLAYVRLQKQRDGTKAQRLKESLHLIGMTKTKSKHTIFVQSKQQADEFDAAKHFDTAPELVERTFNRPRHAQLGASQQQQDNDDDEAPISQKDLKRQKKEQRARARIAAKARSQAYAEFEARSQRARAMERAEAHLVTEKLVAGKGRKRKVKGKTEDGMPAQYKWRRKRKR